MSSVGPDPHRETPRRRYDATPGLPDALCALSLFRHRHDRKGKGRKRYRDMLDYYTAIRLARSHIAKARACGWRGSIIQAVTQAHAA